MITKRQLGIMLVVFTVLAVIGLLVVDRFGAGQSAAFGPLQKIGLGLGAAGLIVGLLLILRGHRPA